MILSNISVPLLGLVDTAVVGHLDKSWYLGAVAVGAMIFSFLYNGVNFLRMGTTGVAAQAFGADDSQAIHRALKEALIVGSSIGLVMLTCGPWLRDLSLHLMSPEPAVLREAAIYFDIRIFSAPATLLSYVFIGWFLGLSNARAPLIIVLVINLSNIALDLLFVLGLGMTTNGVALASVIAEYLGLATAIVLARQALGNWQAAIGLKDLLNAQHYKRYFTVNANIFVRTMALMFTLFFITAQSARLGTVVLAANSILLNLQLLTAYLLDALAHAAEALVGKTEGQNDRKALINVVKRVFLWAALIAAAIAGVFLVGGSTLIAMLTGLEEVREMAGVFLIWLIISPLVSVWSFVYDGVFIGATWTKEMRNAMLLSAFAVFVPAWWLSQPLGNHGLWLAFSLFMLARAISMHVYYLKRTGIANK